MCHRVMIQMCNTFHIHKRRFLFVIPYDLVIAIIIMCDWTCIIQNERKDYNDITYDLKSTNC